MDPGHGDLLARILVMGIYWDGSWSWEFISTDPGHGDLLGRILVKGIY